MIRIKTAALKNRILLQQDKNINLKESDFFSGMPVIIYRNERNIKPSFRIANDPK